MRARLILSSVVVSFHYQQEETVGDIGYFRVRCTLINGERATAYRAVQGCGQRTGRREIVLP